ncbi:hypothetical protein KC324_g10534, partial [Hortaea werneckii]
TGIVVWDVLKREPGETEIEDAALVLESAVVPGTGFVRPGSRQRKAADAAPGGERNGQPSGSSSEAELGERVGEVQNFIVLEHLILFNTDLGKVFASQIHWENDSQTLSEPIELSLPTATVEEETSNPADQTFTTDIQGSFRSFAVFTRSGAVLTSTQDILMANIFNPSPPNASDPTDPELPTHLWTAIPALQNNNVISLAFGDYHYHALHSTGAITSYGREPQACGALGLGGGQKGDPEGRLRGIRYQGVGGDGRLVPHAYMRGGGRQVWFDDESWREGEKGKGGNRREWIRFLTSGGVDPEEAAERMRLALGSPGIVAQGEVSEWVEREGRRWEERFVGKGSSKGQGGEEEDDDDGLGAYFALSVAAAGWHSAAVVLVNEDLVERVRKGCGVRKDDSATAEAPEGEEETTPSSSSSSSLLNRATATAEDYTGWFLGLHPYSAPSPAPPQHPPQNSSTPNHTIEQIHPPPSPHPSASTSSRPGYVMLGLEYAWAGDHFPRLRLSDGTEMPGTVEFDSWREEDGGQPAFGRLVGEVERLGLGQG